VQARIRAVKAYEINHTDAGIEADVYCVQCEKQGNLCRFYRDSKRGSTCGECEMLHIKCSGGVRSGNEGSMDDSA
jgi:hypothetical protein